MKEAFSCSDTIHNSAWTHYTLQNNVTYTRAYQGDLVGFDAEDVELIGCKEITANTDMITLSRVVKNDKSVLIPNTFNIIENDTIHAPLKTTLAANLISIKPANIRNIQKELLYVGSSDGISSRGIARMTEKFKTGNRLE